ncbi:hypothetical protein GcC1_104010, partial [Golovinomyces cichoracearum]
WLNSCDRALKVADRLVADLPSLRTPKSSKPTFTPQTPQLLLLPPPPIPKKTMSSPSQPASPVAVTMTNEQLNRLIRRLAISPQIGNNRDEGIRSGFRPQDLGSFEPENEAENFFESIDNKKIYHVFSFTARICAKCHGITEGSFAAAKVAMYLDQCLKGKAELWYTNEISNTTRVGLRASIENWYDELEFRFRMSPRVALEKLERLKYTIADVRKRQDPEKFVQSIIVSSKCPDDWFDIYKPFNNDLKRFNQERSQPNSFAKRLVISNQPGTSHPREHSYRHNVGNASKNRLSGKGEFSLLEKKTDKFREQDKKFGKMRAYKSEEHIAEEEPEKSEALNDETGVYDRAYYQGMEKEEEGTNEQKDNDYVGPYLEDLNLVEIPNKPETTPLELNFKHMTQQDLNKPTIKTAEKDKMCRMCHLEFYSNNKLHNHLRHIDKLILLNLIIELKFRKSYRQLLHQATQRQDKLSEADYAQMQLRLNSPQNETYSVCLDTGCGMSLTDREFLRSLCPTIEIQNMKKGMKVKDLGSKLYDASQFIEMDFYLPTSKGIIAHFRREIHIVDKLDARIVLGMYIALPEGWIIDLDSQLLTLPYCAGV